MSQTQTTTPWIHPTQLTPDEQKKIIDVREPDEFMQEHIPDSQNIPTNQLLNHFEKLTHQPLILSCRSGRRAEEAANLLRAKGHTDIQLLEGGLIGWKAAKKETRSFKRGYTIMQQVQIIVGVMVLTGFFFKPLWFLAPIAGLGMLIAGLTNTCMMAVMLSKMPWNNASSQNGQSCSM